MPFALLLFYRVLGILLWVLVLLMLWEKYRIVRGGTLLPAQILDCCKSSQSDTPAQPSRRDALINPRVGAGGYCYRVVFTANGQRMERHTNDSFWFHHDGQQGKTVRAFGLISAKGTVSPSGPSGRLPRRERLCR